MNRIGMIAGSVSACMLLATSAWAANHGAMAPAADAPVSTTVTASDCWIRQLPAPAPSGGFLVFHNAGSQAVNLVGARSSDYAEVMIHQTKEENGISKMSMVHQVAVPAGGQLAFKPGSYHMMLEQARAGLKVGDHVQVDFALDNGQRVTAQCEVKPANAMPGMAGHAMKH